MTLSAPGRIAQFPLPENHYRRLIAGLVFLFILYVTSRAQLGLDLEGGAARFGYNDVRISGSEGTQFSLANDFQQKTVPFYRARVQYCLAKRHTLLALYAPLSVESSGTLGKDVYFEGATFKAGVPLSYTWKFNSYRLSYQYAFVSTERLTLAAGLTAKVRDAKIALRNEAAYAEKTNVGVVPLVRFYADWAATRKLHLIMDGDALVSGRGRAEDVLFAVGYQAGQNLGVRLGYRILEGGADNAEVYNFSSVHYAAVGITLFL